MIIGHPLISDLISITQTFKTDPILLTAVCRLTLKVCEQEEVCNDNIKIRQIIKRIASCNQLIPYLGLSKYEELLKMTARYNKRKIREKDVFVQLQFQDNQIIHDLFISIIKLINFFCLQYEKRKMDKDPDDFSHKENQSVYEAYEVCCQSMNENEREDAMFNCLEVPSDDVRLEVVKCLYNVPLAEYDNDEILKLINVISTQNIGAGKTEIVLSQIYWILTKMIIDKELDVGKDFR